ncbi:hypothetical protein [Arthrobacter celericrescens]|uniref:hypothetical protein n=1 Tax=Arthrobacter celericrescens TaxID=2320851 RepID=UPI000EA06431|nr:hypothetical protein [Arthrobacter celericrescens]
MAKRSIPTPQAPKPSKQAWVDTRGLSAKDKKAKVLSVQPVAIDDKLFKWSAQEVDHEHSGEWDWDLSPKETADLLDLLSRTSELTWREVKELTFNASRRSRALHHAQPVGSICEAAQRRLHDIGRGDQEEVFRLRHGNLIRVWGVLEGPVFSILWYDRNHKVCPSDP